MDLKDYRNVLNDHQHSLNELEGEKPFRELGMAFDEDNFQIALDRLGLRSFDLLDSYVPELEKQIQLEAMVGSQYREEVCERL